MDFGPITESLTCGRVLSLKTFSGKEHKAFVPKVETFGKGSVDLFFETFCEEIRKSCKRKKKIGLALSGGKDSRTLLCALLRLDIKPECVTWSYSELDPEVKIAKKICNRFGLKHKYIKIKPEMYFNKKNEKTLIKLADGSPLYFDMMLWYAIRKQLNHNILFCGNLMTEYMDTAEYRTYEGVDISKALMDKETLIPFTENFEVLIKKLTDFYYDEPIEQVITYRMLDRIVQLHIMKNFINWDYPVLNERVLSELFSLPLSKRKGSKLTREILKKYNPALYKLPTGRSPLSLRYPLIFHQAYQRLSKRKISKGLEHLLPSYMDKNETVLRKLSLYEFVNEERLNNFLDKAKGRTYRIGMSRLLNLYNWSIYNGKDLDSL